MDPISKAQIATSITLVIVTAAYTLETYKMRSIENKKIKHEQLPDKIVIRPSNNLDIYGEHNLHNIKAFVNENPNETLEISSFTSGGPDRDISSERPIPLLKDTYSIKFSKKEKENIDSITIKADLMHKDKVEYRFSIEKKDSYKDYTLENIKFK